MKPVKVELKNRAKIVSWLDDVNGRAMSKTISTYVEIAKICDFAEAQLALLSKKERAGASLRYVPAGESTYKKTSTEIRVERRATGWFLVDVQKTIVLPRWKEIRDFKITNEQAEKIQSKALEGFTVK